MNRHFYTNSSRPEPPRRWLAPLLASLLLTTFLFIVYQRNPPLAKEAAVEPEPAETLAVKADAEAAQAGEEPEPEPPPEPRWTWHENRFDAKRPFYYQLTDLGLSGNQVHQLINALTPVYDFRKARPEHSWKLGMKDGAPECLTLVVSPVEIYDLAGLSDEPNLVRREIKTYTERVIIRGEMRGSLFLSLSHAPRGDRLAMMLSEVFAWDIDFYQDPREGDRFEMLVEKSFFIQDGAPVFHGYGRIWAAHYTGARGDYQAYWYEGGKTKPGYYNLAGKSLIRDVLRSPLKLRSVSSSFNPRRFHPILKRVKAHNGVDYRADRNTPVMAVASGKVVTAGRNGGAGIAVEIRHDKEMLTQYFHLNKIAAGVRRGVRVRQGQVIGYVGKTGLATSYHLHFGMKIRGKFVDPQKQKFQPGVPIRKQEMAAFKRTVDGFLHEFQPRMVEPIVKVRAFFAPAEPLQNL